MYRANIEDLDQDRLICFLHIPKTGGKTMWKILDEQSGSYLVWHGKYFKKLKKPVVFFTMLRDPIDRVISTYYYIKRYERDHLHNQVKNMSLEEFVSYLKRKDIDNERYPSGDIQIIRYRIDNLATRYISGGDPLNLEQAKINITNYFPVVGFTDMYIESLFLMKKFFNWDEFSSFEKRNVTLNRPNISEIPPDIIKTIKEANINDTKLYEWAKRDFIKKLQNLDDISKRELKSWRGEIGG
ncbi:sulfotransferase family 2 domain-containing protein [Metabacillus litoralis]|jgi:hypothetical protein|uniref:sulfotransferase family 2 domain-containing protein n=1 Tax=Metabacillus litoralis TaxID=152268 RepID=UPI00203C06BF|nr:sulfotransferase family 2 domain-containing protein [Metabacillus litoralis]MCM3654520.1 sulfotransferase family protein [Metabacillus litoralis]